MNPSDHASLKALWLELEGQIQEVRAEGGVGGEADRLARENELLDKQRNVELLLELIEDQQSE